jgi:hypothetical protein
VAVSVGDGVCEGVGSGKVGSAVMVMVAVGEGELGDEVTGFVGVETAEIIVLSFEAIGMSEVSVLLSHEVKMTVKTSKMIKLILLVIFIWPSSFFRARR